MPNNESTNCRKPPRREKPKNTKQSSNDERHRGGGEGGEVKPMHNDGWERRKEPCGGHMRRV